LSWEEWIDQVGEAFEEHGINAEIFDFGYWFDIYDSGMTPKEAVEADLHYADIYKKAKGN